MLAKKYSLRDKKIFEALKFKGQKEKIGPFLLSFFNDESLKKHHCFGIIVSQKRVAKASARNKIKRKIRSLLYNYKNKKKHNMGFLDLAIIVLGQPAKKDYHKLNLYLQKFFL